jgi:hypothetical protein
MTIMAMTIKARTIKANMMMTMTNKALKIKATMIKAMTIKTKMTMTIEGHDNRGDTNKCYSNKGDKVIIIILNGDDDGNQ